MSLAGSPESLVRHCIKKPGKLVVFEEMMKTECWVATMVSLDRCIYRIIHCNIQSYVCGKRVSTIYDYVQSKALMIISISVSIHAATWRDLWDCVSSECWQ